MRLQSSNLFWTARSVAYATTVILVGAVVCLAPSQVKADWTYEYEDNFSTDKAETESYLHSIFWPQGAFPPSQPYLYYLDTGSQRELAFGDYNGQPARLGYCFPSISEKPYRAISGYLQVDVRFPYSSEVSSGYLIYQFSVDGVSWSTSQRLEPGSHNIPIESVRGRCYVRFRGSEVLIDNLKVYLYSFAATIHVPQDFSTIQAAINSANNGDIVEVAPGIYRGDGNRDIDFRGKAITVRSTYGPEHTIIDCGGEGHRGFYFHRSEGPNSVLRGFTIEGAAVSGSEIPPDDVSWISNSTHPIGGGIYCEFSSPTIVDCVIKQCSTELGGGIGSVGGAPAIIDSVIEQCNAGGLGPAESGGFGAGIGMTRGSDVSIVNCQIRNNTGYYNSCGAGVYCWQSSALLADCDISFNNGQGEGGGLYCGGSSAGVVLQRCIVSNNTAETGGGIFAGSLAYVRVTNCTVVDNKLTWLLETVAGGIHSTSSDTVIRNSIVWYNDGTAVVLDASALDSQNGQAHNSVLYSNIEGYYPGQANINAVPLFASSTDYHLQSVLGRYDPYWDEWVVDSEHSPCIDTGDPQDSVGSEPFPNSNRINMGAYGGTNEASKSIGPLIFHVDGTYGSDFNTGLSRASAFATIQRAVDETIDGDAIMVWPGMYEEEITFSRKRISVQSASDAAHISAPAGYAFSFYGAESSRSTLRNFVITNCGEGAIFCHGSQPEFINLTIADNQFGIYADGGADPSITNCILWNNEFGDLFGDPFQPRAHYSCLQQLRTLDEERGNISTDPVFVDPANGDYHLQSRYGRYKADTGFWMTDPVTSPCIDAGDPGMYPGRERMPHGGRVNMGAYGGTPFASMSSP